MLKTRDILTLDEGTGARFANIITTLAGVSALSATLLTFVSVWLQSKNYRKPLLQRYVVRILLMVPIYSAASWASLTSQNVAFWVDPFRDVYEAFTIYTFFQLLINFIGGERQLIVLMHGRPPVSHLYPLNYILPKVDISDPHTFLAIKRGILQYTWIKPILSIATIILKATGTYQEGDLSVDSGYLWNGIIYNLSITVSLYALAMFWVCMSQDLKPFRPMPKFLCIKGIIFASYWQGFFLSILVWLGAIPSDTPGYTADTLAASIQDALICFEMPIFAITHWYAFSWHDYADVTISAARMPVKFALRDAFGPRDLIEDAKDTFSGEHYEYRAFDADDNVLAHEESSSRVARMMEGMRYERGGKGKYWIPKPGNDSARSPLLAKVSGGRARTMSPAGGMRSEDRRNKYGTTGDIEETTLDPEEEKLYDNARALEFGDWNYPVITAHTATREHYTHADPNIVTASTNRHLLQPTKRNRERRQSRIKEIQQSADKGKHRSNSSNGESSRSKSVSRRPVLGSLLRHESSSSESAKSDNSQLVDLVVEDHEAEEVERVRARKEGGPGWNEVETKHFIHTFPEDDQAEDVREGFDPDKPEPSSKDKHNLDAPFAVGNDEDGVTPDKSDDETHWERRDYDGKDGENGNTERSPQYGSFHEERNAWGARDDEARGS
ncbi:DUF300-domain-containing protein [Patellaria atrata CBS 101060]|uniref:DUF300-domain-containing protein n=1 Tax=Patellaria atrata CBS 101060 TaxID=1346257 RepID=A0A9P4VR63_9PEZI|nr:DUF300-domain-containing protein [Patellaria atrata CBS 101060]